jgi:WD40 repeat protein
MKLTKKVWPLALFLACAVTGAGAQQPESPYRVISWDADFAPVTIRFSPNGKFITSTPGKYYWDVQTGKLAYTNSNALVTFRGKNGFSFFPSGDLIVFADKENSVRFSVSSFPNLEKIIELPYGGYSACVSPSGKYIVTSGTNNFLLYTYPNDTGERIKLGNNNDRESFCQFHPKLDIVLISNIVGGSQLWDVAKKQMIWNRPKVNGYMIFSPDGNWLGIPGSGVYNAATGDDYRRFRTSKINLWGSNAVAFSADSKILYNATNVGEIAGFDIATGSVVRYIDVRKTKYFGKGAQLTGLEVSPDGRTLVAGVTEPSTTAPGQEKTSLLFFRLKQ